ncbi:MAG: hypothetical protein RBS07_03575 [Lentimicrobium sp.]|jgi:hypothetical protein|nr:hypothetical protein [Lentimicrobium sp.]
MAATRSFRRLYLILLTALCFSQAFGQTNPVKESLRLDIQFGGRFIHRTPQPIKSDIDFLDYSHNGTGNNNYGVMSIGISLSPNERWTFVSELSMLSDLLPSHMQIAVVRQISSINPLWDLGIKGQVYLYPQYLDEFNQFHLKTDTTLIADLDHNYRQRTLFDMGISAMPFLKYKSKRLQATFASGIGLNSFIPFSEVITQKKANENFRREIRYKTQYGAALTSHTEIELTYQFYHNSDFDLGLLIQAEFLLSFRNLAYQRTIMTWTEETQTIDNIKPKNHFYSKSDLSGGLFLKF